MEVDPGMEEALKGNDHAHPDRGVDLDQYHLMKGQHEVYTARRDNIKKIEDSLKDPDLYLIEGEGAQDGSASDPEGGAAVASENGEKPPGSSLDGSGERSEDKERGIEMQAKDESRQRRSLLKVHPRSFMNCSKSLCTAFISLMSNS